MKKKLITKTTLAVMLAVFSSTAAMGQSQKDNDSPNWLNELKSRITINGYVQGGYSWNDMGGEDTNDFNFKRCIVWAKARITDRWSFQFMYDFASSPLEYYTDYRITKNNALNFRIGQFKNSLTLENPMSPSALELVDVCSQSVTCLAGCNDPLYGKHGGRDLGAMIFGDLLNNKLHYELAVMNGQGINVRDGNNHKDFIGKLELRPIDGLRIVTSGQIGKGHSISETGVAWNPSIALGDDYTRNRYSIGAEYKFGEYSPGKYKEGRPVSIRAEWLGGKDGDVGSRGGYITTTIPVAPAFDIIGSADTFNKNTSVDGWDQTNLTLGVQYWYYKKCRVQLQYTRGICGDQIYGGKDYNNVQAQVQVAF